MKKSKSQWLDHFPGTCSPENQTKVIKASQGKSEIFFPGCIKIPQCSGCCPSDRLTCQPINTSNISIEVMVLRYIPHSRQFKYAGRQRFTFEGHNQCECKCIQKETDCTFGQLYKKEECRCVCRDLSNLSECTSNSAKYWDSSSCSCKCLHHHKCSSGLHFNEKTCSCDTNYYNGSKFYQFGSTNIHNQLMDQVNSLNNSKKNAPSPTTTQLDSSDGFNLLSGNNQDEEFNEMDKLHRSLGYQGINPSSSTVP
ncbi:vascular endothelial growth factor A-like isoform X2 [Panonychus citri]|nr:vascular endothelial growth factor A-like isoform X2 [Panonychus citri]